MVKIYLFLKNIKNIYLYLEILNHLQKMKQDLLHGLYTEESLHYYHLE